MYLDFYGLTKAPFHSTPDSAFLFLSPSHTAALRAMIDGVEKRQGVVAILGEAGVGKTTLLRCYLECVDPQQLTVMVIMDAQLSWRDLLQTLCRYVGRAVTTDDPGELVQQFHEILREEHHQGRRVALLIDAAERMPVETLAGLPLLAPLETPTESLLQIVMLGHLALQDTLQREELGPLRQRLVLCTTIAPLTAEESVAYIRDRLAQVTRCDNPVFTDDALQRIVQQAQGIPRTLHSLCTHALLAGVRAQQRPITATLVDSVITACTTPPPRPRWQRRLAVGASLGLVASLLWGVLWQGLSSRYPLFPTSLQAQALRRTADRSPAAQVQTSAESASIAGPEHDGNTHGTPPPRLEAPSAQSATHIRHNAPEKPRASGVGRPRHAGRRQAASPRASRQPQPPRYAESRQHEATRHTFSAAVSPNPTRDVKRPWYERITNDLEP